MGLKATERNDAELENLREMEVRNPIDEEVELFPVRGGIPLGRARGCMSNHLDHNALTQRPAELKLRKKMTNVNVESYIHEMHGKAQST